MELFHNRAHWTELDDTKSCYQLIISTTKFEKEKGENVPTGNRQKLSLQDTKKKKNLFKCK